MVMMPFGAAVFVHHNGDVYLFPLHLFEQVVGLDGVRHKVGGAQQLLDGGIFAGFRPADNPGH